MHLAWQSAARRVQSAAHWPHACRGMWGRDVQRIFREAGADISKGAFWWTILLNAALRGRGSSPL